MKRIFLLMLYTVSCNCGQPSDALGKFSLVVWKDENFHENNDQMEEIRVESRHASSRMTIS